MEPQPLGSMNGQTPLNQSGNAEVKTPENQMIAFSELAKSTTTQNIDQAMNLSATLFATDMPGSTSNANVLPGLRQDLAAMKQQLAKLIKQLKTAKGYKKLSLTAQVNMLSLQIAALEAEIKFLENNNAPN